MRYARLFALAILLPLCPAANTGNGSNTCPASGNKVVSSTQLKTGMLIIQAPSANTGLVYVGGSTVSSTSGVFITPGGTFYFAPMGNSSPYDLSQIRFACTVTADTITYTYVQ